MSINIETNFEDENDGAESFLINGLKLRVNPTDIQVFNNKNPEIVGMMRSDKPYVFASKFVNGRVAIYIAFDLQNAVDQANLISLSTYLDLYPFVFIKSDRLARYTAHTYQGAFDYQIYGVHSYSISTNSDIQGAYILTMEIEYFNFVPLARNLAFINPIKQSSQGINPTTGQTQTGSAQGTVPEVDISECQPFNTFFQSEIFTRINNLETLLGSKGKNFFGLGVPQFHQFTDQQLASMSQDDLNQYEKIIASKLRDPADTVTIANQLDASPTIPDVYYVKYVDLLNPITKSNNLNEGGNATGGGNTVKNITITKRNMIASIPMASYPYPVLQYMGKGQTDIYVEMRSQSAYENDQISVLQLIKQAFTQIDANYYQLNKVAAFNVMKVICPLTSISPIFGALLIGDKVEASAQDQGAESFFLYMMEQDNRGVLRRSQFIDSGAQAGADLDLIVADFVKLSALVDAGTSPSPVITAIKSALGITKPAGITQAQLDSLTTLSQKYNLPTGLLYGIMMAESKGNPNAVSVNKNTGQPIASGAFQFTPGTAAQLGINPLDFDQAADGAARYLAQNLATFNGNVNYAIAAYNAGPGSVQKAIASGNPDSLFSPTRVTPDGYTGETGQYLINVTKYMNSAGGATVAATTNSSPADNNAARNACKSLMENIGSSLDQNIAAAQSQTNSLSVSPSAAGVPGIIANTLFSAGEAVGNALTDKYYTDFKDYLTNYATYKQDPVIDPIYDRVFQDAYIKLYQLSQQGNSYATAVLKGSGDTYTNLLNQLDDKFRQEGVPDLNFSTNFPTSYLTTLGITDVRQIPPFFFLNSSVYFGFDGVSQVYDIIGNFAKDPGQANTILQNELGAVINGLSKDDQNTSSIFTQTSKNPTDFSKVKLQSDVFTVGQTRTQLDESNQGDIFNQPTPAIDPLNPVDIINQQKISVTSYFKHGMNIAFPVIKVYIVEGDETTFFNKLVDTNHFYYELDGLIEARLATNNDENPMDVFVFSLANPGSIYTDALTLFDKYYPTKNLSNLGTPQENRFRINNIRVKTGLRIHVRGGYGNNANELEPMFSGVITEIGGDNVLECIAEGYGRELALIRHGDDPSKNTFVGNANTSAIVGNALNSGEVEHFGNFKVSFFEKDPEAKRYFSSAAGIFDMWKASNKYTNIWLDSIEKFDSDYDSSFINIGGIFSTKALAWYSYPVFRLTPYDMLKEMEWRHPGILSKPALYDDRMTYFFGLKEQLYIYRSVDPRIESGSNSLASAASSVAGAVVGTVFGGLPGAVLGGLLGNGLSLFTNKGDQMYQQARSKRFRPICDIHLATSEHNIIHNKMKATDEFHTAVNVQYWKDVSDIKDNKFDHLLVQGNDSLRPSAIRQGELAMTGCNGILTAGRYGATQLRREFERMYDGEISIIGNPRIKADDFLVINDRFRKMYGIVKVRECVHEWSMDGGYRTKITPGMYTETHWTKFPLSTVFPLLYSASYLLTEVNNTLAQAQFASNKEFLLANLAINNIDQSTQTKTDYQNVMGKAGGTALGTWLTTNLINDVLASKAAQLFLGAREINVGSSAVSQGVNLIKAAPAAAFNGLRSIAQLAVTDGLVSSTGAAVVGRGLLWTGRIMLFDNPLALALSVLVGNIYTSIAFKLNLREPVKIFPVVQNGSQYIAGIYGYQEQPIFSSWLTNAKANLDDLSTLTTALTGALNSGLH